MRPSVRLAVPERENAPLTTTVTCTATDAVQNTSTGTFTVTVVSPFGYIPDFVVLGRDWASLSSGAVVLNGNVGGFDQSTGVPGRETFELVAGPSASFQGGSQLAAHSDALEASTLAGDAFYVDKITGGNGAVFTPKVGYVPLFFSMPAVPSFAAAPRREPFVGRRVAVGGNVTLAEDSAFVCP